MLRNQDSTVLTVHPTDLWLIAQQALINKQPVSIHSWHKAASCKKGICLRHMENGIVAHWESMWGMGVCKGKPSQSLRAVEYIWVDPRAI